MVSTRKLIYVGPTKNTLLLKNINKTFSDWNNGLAMVKIATNFTKKHQTKIRLLVLKWMPYLWNFLDWTKFLQQKLDSDLNPIKQIILKSNCVWRRYNSSRTIHTSLVGSKIFTTNTKLDLDLNPFNMFSQKTTFQWYGPSKF